MANPLYTESGHALEQEKPKEMTMLDQLFLTASTSMAIACVMVLVYRGVRYLQKS